MDALKQSADFVAHLDEHEALLAMTTLSFDEKVGFLVALFNPRPSPDAMGPLANAIRRIMIERQRKRLRDACDSAAQRTLLQREPSTPRLRAVPQKRVTRKELQQEIDLLSAKVREAMPTMFEDEQAGENIKAWGKRIAALRKQQEKLRA